MCRAGLPPSRIACPRSRAGSRISPGGGAGGRRGLARRRDERKALPRLLARRGEAIPNPDRLWHVALVPTYTEPYEKLYETVRALAESDWPADRPMVAIITRGTG